MTLDLGEYVVSNRGMGGNEDAHAPSLVEAIEKIG